MSRKLNVSLRHQSLLDALLAAPPDRPFLTIWVDEDETYTVSFGDFVREAQLRAVVLREHGLRSGETAVLVMPQGLPLMTTFAAAMLLGAVPAILAYPSFKVDAAKYEAGLVGVTRNLRARLVVVDEDFPSELVAHLSPYEGTAIVRMANLPAETSAPQSVDTLPSPESLAFIQHSAGTTGLQKGVALSHAAVLTQLDHLATSLAITPEDRIYSWLPLYHDMGLIACFMLPLVYHLPVVMQSPLEWVIRPGTMLQLITDYRCTLGWIPNFALQFLARRVRPQDRAGYELSSLRALINCSEPVRAHSMDEFIHAYEPFGLRRQSLKSSYAMAENVFAVTQSDTNGVPARIWVDGKALGHANSAVLVPAASPNAQCFVSSGRCLEGNLVRIVSPDGIRLRDGEVGEIVVRSDSLFRGYYNRPDLTESALKDGWYWTGDLGFVIDGELYVTGRKKDLIIVAGKNIYPQDIEEIVSRHPAVHDGRVVALGLYDEEEGTEGIVIVAELEGEELLRDSSAIERAIRDAVVSEMDVAPRAVHLRPPKWIVKSTAGKPARSTTREKLLKELREVA